MNSTIETDGLRDATEACGLIFFGLLPAGPAPSGDRLDEWFRAGYDAGLSWMRRTRDARMDPRTYRPGTTAVAMVGVAYGTQDPPAAVWDDPRRARVARFAWGPDYHSALDTRLAALSEQVLLSGHGARVLTRFTDSRPVMERAWAVSTGAGFVGKNTQLIRPGRGSFVLLGGLLLAGVRVEPHSAADIPASDPCGECRACLKACPGGALRSARVLDCSRCVSYWTLEHKGTIPRAMARRMGRWVAGCDACQEACPFVASRDRMPEPSLDHVFRAERDAPDPEALFAMDDAVFHSLYDGTPLQRTGRSRLRRNALIVLVNTRPKEAGEWIRRARADEDERMRAQAAELASDAEFQGLGPPTKVEAPIDLL